MKTHAKKSLEDDLILQAFKLWFLVPVLGCLPQSSVPD